MPFYDSSTARSQLVEDALSPFGVEFSNCYSAGFAVITSSEPAGGFRIAGTGDSPPARYLVGEASQGEIEVSVLYAAFTLPAEYVAGGDVRVRVRSGYSGSGTAGTCTIDVQAYEQTDILSGSDLVTTAATAITATIGNKDFVVTATNLVAGDVLTFVVTTSVEETGAAAALQSVIDRVQVLCDIKG